MIIFFELLQNFCDLEADFWNSTTFKVLCYIPLVREQ